MLNSAFYERIYDSMPAKSKAQSKLLHAKFGAEWTRKHGFDNPTKGLPQHVSKKAKKK